MTTLMDVFMDDEVESKEEIESAICDLVSEMRSKFTNKKRQLDFANRLINKWSIYRHHDISELEERIVARLKNRQFDGSNEFGDGSKSMRL